MLVSGVFRFQSQPCPLCRGRGGGRPRSRPPPRLRKSLSRGLWLLPSLTAPPHSALCLVRGMPVPAHFSNLPTAPRACHLTSASTPAPCALPPLSQPAGGLPASRIPFSLSITHGGSGHPFSVFLEGLLGVDPRLHVSCVLCEKDAVLSESSFILGTGAVLQDSTCRIEGWMDGWMGGSLCNDFG